MQLTQNLAALEFCLAERVAGSKGITVTDPKPVLKEINVQLESAAVGKGLAIIFSCSDAFNFRVFRSSVESVISRGSGISKVSKD